MAIVIDRFDGDYHFLSNFYYADTMYDGVLYRTSEHAYQAAKTLDPNERRQVAACRTPGQAKRLGQKVTKRGDWEDIKVSIMGAVVLDKFIRNEDLRKKLLHTGDVQLIEGNNWGDTFWGEVHGEGRNWLGRVLMRVRDQLRPLGLQSRKGLW